MQHVEPKQLVLAKIKGFPDWPAAVVPATQVPSKLTTPKFKKFLEDYLDEENDHICVKFYYDDQYSWTTRSNIKPLSTQIVDDYLISVGELVPDDEHKEDGAVSKRGGRKKRITEAYLKVKQIPMDEFLEWGSWGKPAEPEPEVEEESSVEPEETTTTGRKRRGRAATAEPEVKKRKTGRAAAKVANAKNAKAAAARLGRKPVRGKKGSSTPEYANLEEEFVIPEDKSDDDFEESESIEDEDEEDEDIEDLVDDEEEEEEDEEAEAEEDEEDNEDDIAADISANWGLNPRKAGDLKVKFKDIPTASALVDEVTEMTSWCHNLRLELQKLILPLKKQAPGEPIKEENSNGNNVQKDDNEVTAEPTSVKEETIEAPSDEPEVEIDYKKLNKAVDTLITPLLTADLSKSILKTTGLAKMILILLKKPELQSTSVKKLNKWWTENFHFHVDVDLHWSDDYTVTMHLQDERNRREREEEKRRKRREEKKLLTATPDVEDV